MVSIQLFLWNCTVLIHCLNLMEQTGKNLSPASKASKEVANLTERKNWHTSIYGGKEFVCLSVTNFDPIISGLAEQRLKYHSSFCNRLVQKLII